MAKHCFAWPKKFVNHFFSAIIITGGGPTLRSVEILHSNGRYWCSLPDLPDDREGHTQSGLITCGGYLGKGRGKRTCLSFSDGQWNTSHLLQTQSDRVEHSSWLSKHGVVLMGGYYAFGKSTDILTIEGGSTQSFWLDHETL